MMDGGTTDGWSGARIISMLLAHPRPFGLGEIISSVSTYQYSMNFLWMRPLIFHSFNPLYSDQETGFTIRERESHVYRTRLMVCEKNNLSFVFSGNGKIMR